MPKPINDRDANARLMMAALPLELGQDPGEGKQELVSVLMFEVGGAPYAIGVEHTEGVVDCPRITPLPNPPDGVAGIASVRGRMTVVMDLGPNVSEQPARRRLILVKGDAQLGMLADRVEGVFALEPGKVRPVAHGKDSLTLQRAEFGWPAGSYFKSGRQRVPILDLERLCEG
ncbi:MAG TPA: chemotaxis protein CheW [Blastocatellia bacterium]|nr:chemotaxis protein CheW [Blastocatellia bacterium]